MLLLDFDFNNYLRKKLLSISMLMESKGVLSWGRLGVVNACYFLPSIRMSWQMISVTYRLTPSLSV